MRIFAFLKFLIDLVTSVLMVLLGVRLAFKLFGANSASPLVGWVYRISDPIIAPVRGIFTDQQLNSGNVVEYSTLLAIVLVAIAGFLLIQLLDALQTASLRSSQDDYLDEGPRGYGRRSTDEPTVVR